MALRHTDDVCLKTSFPWILHANSAFLMTWDTLVVIYAVLVGIVYPYSIGFEKKMSLPVEIFSYIVDVAFTFDVIIQLFTAVETDQGIIEIV